MPDSRWTSTSCWASSASATLGDIKRAYRRLARRYHPDINPGRPARGGAVPPDRRGVRDAERSGSAPALRQRRRRRRRRASSRLRLRGVRLLGERQRRIGVRPSAICSPTCCSSATQRSDGEPERGADLHQSLTLPFEEAMRGGQRDADDDAGRTRAAPARAPGRLQAAESRCLHCHGAGIVKSARGHMVFSKPCADCGGTGRQAHDRCPSCGGQQVERRSRDADASSVPRGARRRRPRAGRRQGACGPQRRRARRPVPHGPRRAASVVPPRGRRPAHRRADRDPRGGARREGRGAVARRPRARCACRRARSPASASACASAACRRPATAGAAISSSKCGWCCRACSTSGRRSCCGSSAG